MDAFGAELREFIRRLNVAEGAARATRRDLTALRQGMRDGWGTIGGRLTGMTTIYPQWFGYYYDNSNAPFSNNRTPAGVQFTFVDDATGLSFGPFTTATDSFWPGPGFEIGLPPGSPRTITTYVDPVSPRFGAAPAPYSSSVVPGASNFLGLENLLVQTAPSGYGAWNLSDLPLADPLYLDDPVRGYTALPWPAHMSTQGYYWQMEDASFPDPPGGHPLYRALSMNGSDPDYFDIISFGHPSEVYPRTAVSNIVLPTIASPATKFSCDIAVAGGTIHVYEI